MIDTIVRPIVDLKKLFVPVIFANGEDDDTQGLIAAIENERVQFDEKIYDPGEHISISDRKILLSPAVFTCIWLADNRVTDLLYRGTAVKQIKCGRKINIVNSQIGYITS